MDEPNSPTTTPAADAPPRELHISIASKRSWASLLGYIFMFVACSAALVWLLVQFSTPIRLAVIIALFMVGYMLLMGWWAGRNEGS